ncbi:MAG: hypothetical protein GX661_02050, partial [Acholeplasmataceae bacterium]|nr:hypothetical protein [Acholeplasmataceae bacterium]
MEEGHTLELQMREIALLIDGFAKEADEIVEIGEKLKGVKEQDFRLDIFRQPFYYDIALKNDDGRGEKYDTFVPIVEGDGYCFPPLVENIPESHLNLYKDILPFLIERIPIAIYSDILWVRHVENGDKFARRAIEAYSVASENDRHQIRGTRLLGRALEISKEINDKKLMESLLEKNRDHLVDTMKLSDAVDRPGVVLRYIDNILEAPASYWDSLGLIKILDDVSVIYDGNAYIMQVILEHKARVKPEKKVLFYEEIVKIYLEEARSATSTIQKNKFLLDALEAAKNGNLKDWIIDLEVKLYETKDEPKDWNVIEKEIPIPTELIEKLFNTVLIHDSLETASLAFGSIVPVQDIDSIAAFVADLRRDHPLQFLVSRQIYDANNVLIKECLTDEDLYTLALVDQDKLAISIYGALFPELLRRLNNKFSMQSPEQLDKLFTNTL